jgi:hypothetical protein
VLVAHEAVAAGDVERDHDAIPDRQLADARPDRLDDPHGLVPEDVALGHERAEHLVDVEVRPAQPARRDADDGVGRLLDRRIGDRVHADVALAVPGHCLHRFRPVVWVAEPHAARAFGGVVPCPDGAPRKRGAETFPPPPAW